MDKGAGSQTVGSQGCQGQGRRAGKAGSHGSGSQERAASWAAQGQTVLLGVRPGSPGPGGRATSAAATRVGVYLALS